MSSQPSIEDQIEDRYNAFFEFYNSYINSLNSKYSDSFFLCPEIVYEVVKSYYDDIYRFKDYAGSKYADQHKQAAYTIKWISKLRPIQLKEGSIKDKTTLLINASFSLYVGLSFLKINFGEISPKLFQHLLYSTQYRNISGKQLATTLYILECSCNKTIP